LPGPIARLERLEPGAHLCRFDEDDASRDRGGAAFVRHGLSAGRRVVYVTQGRGRREVEGWLHDCGVPAGRALRSGQLVVCDFADLYGDRTPCPGTVEAGYRSMQAHAVADGLPGLWVAAEMGQAVSRFGSVEQLLAWERLSTRWYREIGVSTVCQYDRGHLSSGDLELVAAQHTGIAPPDAPPPAGGCHVEPGGFRIHGEVDASNVDQLVAALAARLAVQPRLTLDLVELSFLDVGTVRALYRLVREHDGAELTVRNASPSVRRCLELTGLHDPRLVVA
jgi:anti-anti-sigma factor